MFNQSFLFLVLLLVIGGIAKNPSLIVATTVLIILQVFQVDSKVFSLIQSKGINWGVTIITIAVLAPIASGKIGFSDLGGAVKSPAAWIALGAGVAVAIIAKYGIDLLSTDPHMTTALVLGTIIAVAVFKGVAVGPLIGAGIAYMVMRVVDLIKSGIGLG